MFYGFEQNAARAKSEIDDALGQRMRQMQQPMQAFQEGGLATSVHMPQDFHARDVDFINTRNQHMRELVGKVAYAEGGAVSANGGQAVTSIPMPVSFTPMSVPKAAAPQPQYGPLMQSLMAKQAAAAKVAAPQPAMPQLAVQKPAMPMPPAPTDAGPMPSEAGIPLWRQLAPGPERDAAYARYMNAQSTPTAPQPVAPANAGTPAWTQYMGDLTGPQPVASGPAPNSLPLGSGFNVTLPQVAPNMFSSAPTAPMSPAPTDAGPMRSDPAPLWRQLRLSGPEQDPAYMQYLNTQSGPQPTPTMPQSFMPQPVMPKPAMPQRAMPQPQYGPRMLGIMARQRAMAQPQYFPQLSRLLTQYR